MKLAAAVVLACVPVLAHADPHKRVATATHYDGPPGAELDAPPVVDVAPPPPPVAPIDLARDNALSSRGLVVGTALTVPEGHVEVTGRALLPVGALASLTAGLSGSTEVWVDYGGVMAFDEDEAYTDKTYGFGIKQVFAKGATWAASASASLRRIDREEMYTASAAMTSCNDPSCHTMFSVSGGLAHIDRDTIPVVNASMLAGGDVAKVSLEAMWLGHGALGVLGLRLGGSSIAVDLGVGIPVEGDSKVIPLPMLGIAARI